MSTQTSTAKFTARTHGHGTTHLHSTIERTVKVHGIPFTGTFKALCGAMAGSKTVELGEVDQMPEVSKPCAKCVAASR